MSSSTVELTQESRVKQDPAHLDRGSASPPALQPQESIKNASLVNQSPSAKRLSTSPRSPHHHRFKSVNATDSPSITTVASSDKRRPSSSPSALPTSTTSPSTTRVSYFSSQPGSSDTEARSPATKRPPASRSSHGIATANGPPPALITQRSYHGEPWRNPSPSDQPSLPPDPPQQSQTKGSASALLRQNSTNSRTNGGAKLEDMNGIAANHGAISNAFPHRSPKREEEDDDTLRTLGGTRRPSHSLLSTSNGDGHVNAAVDDHSYSSNEDLFLHLARTDSEAGSALTPTNGANRRGSQAGLSSSRPHRATRPWGSRPASSGQELGGERSEDQISHWSRSGRFDTPMNGHQPSPRDRAYAASAHPLDAGKRRYLHSELTSKASFTTPRVRNGLYRETSPELPGSHGRRQSITESASGLPSRSYKHSGRSYVSGNHYDSSPLTNVDPVRTHQSFRPEGTESTISTTAPSTVWDELDDLKSRIRKLELTGKLPSSSGAAMSGAANGRPRTASTTMTTASISPKHGRAATTSPEASTVKDADTSSLHPLLHSALAKAKILIDPKAYKALETASSDATKLAALAGKTKSTGAELSAQGNSVNIDRQLRRKADSMCRSLTEVCIALSEEKSSKDNSTSISRSGSKAANNDVQTPENPQNLRASSQEPERSSSRILSRLEARRTSLLAANAATPPNGQNNSTHGDSPIIHQDAPTPTQRPTLTDRTPSVLLHRRRTIDGNTPDTNNSRPTSRAAATTNSEQRPSLVSRISRDGTAATATAEQRPSPKMRISREYTSQHPLPPLSSQQRSPSVRASLPSSNTRRPYLASSSPATPPHNVIQPGSRRYVSTVERERQTQTPPPSSLEENFARSAEARQQRIASLGQQYGSGNRRLRLVEGEQG
ncbi:MAG: hypothetical protein LQ338_005492 [Usnochroma carphineum]|nr:MAG: hypothetical protein LQ338_005492 [Usnochroma carphineum]